MQIKNIILLYLLVYFLGCNGNHPKEIWKEFTFIEKKQPISDWGNLFKSSQTFYEVYPRSIHEVQRIIQKSKELSISLRFRGNGHSSNGMSLPAENEVLVKSSSLNYYRFEEDQTITVGAGSVLWDVNSLLQESGYFLPVINGGSSGPTVGGFISAGGISTNHQGYGGFWENVEEIVLVDGKGAIIHTNKKEELFQYIFGSMGQLGFIVEAKLKILPIPKKVFAYPLKKEGRFNTSSSHNKLDGKQNNYIWFGVFAPKDQKEKVYNLLNDFFKTYKEIFQVSLTQFYDIPFLNFHPPLVYSKPEDFIGVEFQGYMQTNSEDYKKKILEMEKAYNLLVIKNNYKRYFQVEINNKDLDYQKLIGEKEFSTLMEYKKRLDPEFLFYRNGMFPFHNSKQ